MGTTSASLHWSGILPDFNNSVNNNFSAGTISSFISFITLAGILSGPEADCSFKESIVFKIPSSVIDMSVRFGASLSHGSVTGSSFELRVNTDA